MVKTEISKKPKASISKVQETKSKENRMNKKEQKKSRVLRDDTNLKEYDPIKNLLDPKRLGAAVMQCLMENDTNGALEIMESYLYAVDRTQFLKDAKISRSTAYNVFKRRNPTLKTIAKMMYASSHS
jgi:DNA-binding phage protein